MLECPAKITLGGDAKTHVLEVDGDLREPSRSVGAVGAGQSAIKMPPPGPVVILHASDPSCGPHHCVEHSAIAGRLQPAVPPMANLRPVERRPVRALVGALDCR